MKISKPEHLCWKKFPGGARAPPPHTSILLQPSIVGGTRKNSHNNTFLNCWYLKQGIACLARPACTHFTQLFGREDAEKDDQTLQVVF